MQEVERVAATVGLKMNEGKTKFITQNIENPDSDSIKSLSNSTIEHVEDFTYLGSRIRDSKSGIRVRKGRAWRACHTLKQLWNSKLRKSIKFTVFTALVESVLLYGSETWTKTKRLEKMVDGCCTRMLRMALNINQYRDHVSNNSLYGEFPKVSSKITQWRLRLAGHAHRHPELTLNKLIL